MTKLHQSTVSKNEFQNIENGVFQNALFANNLFANGRFPNGVTVASGQNGRGNPHDNAMHSFISDQVATYQGFQMNCYLFQNSSRVNIL